MLMRDYSYHIYRSLYSCLEVTDTSVEPAPPSTTTTEPNNDQQEQTETNPDNKEEETEAMITSGDGVILPGLDINTEDNDKKRKRTPSQVNEIFKRRFFL
jgi:acyl-CoA synthetase (AMP-forming)/AMP-acid ligase II